MSAAGMMLSEAIAVTGISSQLVFIPAHCFHTGSWHLFHLLLLEYVTHLFQSCLEEEEEEEDTGILKEALPGDRSVAPPVQALFQPLDPSLPQNYACPSTGPRQGTLEHGSHSLGPMGMSNVVLWVLGFLVDTATGHKVDTSTHGHSHTPQGYFWGDTNHTVARKPTKSRASTPITDSKPLFTGTHFSGGVRVTHSSLAVTPGPARVYSAVTRDTTRSLESGWWVSLPGRSLLAGLTGPQSMARS